MAKRFSFGGVSSLPRMLAITAIVCGGLPASGFAQERANGEAFPLRSIAEQALQSPKEPGQFAIPFEQLRNESTRELPIGVFDSGVGGLTVLETILKLDSYNNDTAQPGADGIPDFQGERFIYLGDQANMPYGNYATKGSTDFLRELIVRDAMFLLGTKYWENRSASTPRWDKPPVKAIVIACNTATAYGLEDIRAALQVWNLPIPVIGVVEAGASALVEGLPAQGPPDAVAVFATVATCTSDAYPKAIARSAGQAGKRVPAIWQQGSIGLAGAIEGNQAYVARTGNETTVPYQGPSSSNQTAPIDPSLKGAYAFDPKGLRVKKGEKESGEHIELSSVDNYVKFDLVEMMEKYKKSGAKSPIAKVILGCTHFPFEADRIEQHMHALREYQTDSGDFPYRDLISARFQLIDPAELTAKELFRTLFAKRLRVSKTEDSKPPHVMEFFFSSSNPKFETGKNSDGNLPDGYKYGRRIGWSEKEDTLVVPFRSEDLPDVLAKLLREKCQYVWNELTRTR